MPKLIDTLLTKTSAFRQISAERDELRKQLELAKRGAEFVPPGHFYSALPDLNLITRDEARIFRISSRDILAVDLHESEQLKLIESFARNYYPDIEFPETMSRNRRYFYENPSYSFSDAIFLHCMIRHHRPKRIIEIGSGYSSAMMMDTNELFLDNSASITFIEPYPDLLISLMRDGDKERVTVLPNRLQEIDTREFERLESNDILFVDSTHVSKVDSDVNRLFFEILPRLSSGVLIHFHDIFFPFEYPKPWIYEGRAWSEIYVLRAFLQYNSAFQVVLMNTFLEYFHEEFFRKNMPLCLKNRGGSFWLKKL
jgi:predicted O-methyltransferase YrrM